MTLRSIMLAIAVGTTLSAAPVQAAPPAPVMAEDATALASQVEQVQYRRGFGGPAYAYRGGYGWRRPGPWIGLGVGVAAGAFIYSQAYLPRRGYYYDTYAYDGPYYVPQDFSGDRRELCARYFKSFEWRTGFYTTYGGERRQCPYLRD